MVNEENSSINYDDMIDMEKPPLGFFSIAFKYKIEGIKNDNTR